MVDALNGWARCHRVWSHIQPTPNGCAGLLGALALGGHWWEGFSPNRWMDPHHRGTARLGKISHGARGEARTYCSRFGPAVAGGGGAGGVAFFLDPFFGILIADLYPACSNKPRREIPMGH